MKEPLEALGNIQEVEISPFLYAKIRERLKNTKENITIREAFSIAIPSIIIASISLLLYFNLNSEKKSTKKNGEFAKVMNLEVNNSLY